MLSLVACKSKETEISLSGFYFDTVIMVDLFGSEAKDAAQKCMELAALYDGLLNKNTETSDIYVINHAGGKTVNVNEKTAEILGDALSFAKETNGRFDPTIGALTDIWDFKSDDPAVPSDAEISDALSHVNYENVILDGTNVTLKDDKAMLDLGGIAKGYIADVLKEEIKNYDVDYGFINLGGNVLTINSKPGNKPFKIGIKDPDPFSDGSITTVEVIDKSVVTSGSYERFFIKDDVLYHHILDTKTGCPVRNNLLSVSIIGEKSTICDALSTILFIKGIDEGTKYLDNYPGYEAIFITDTREIISTDKAR